MGCQVLRLLAAFGAVVSFAAPAFAADPPKTPTFTKDVAPIFQAKCESCHRPDYDGADVARHVRGRAAVGASRSRSASKARQMPPWHIDKTVGIQKFKNDRSLTDDQIDTILDWVAAGAPKGDPKDMPPPKVWSDDSKWSFAAKYGPPDLVDQVARLHDARRRAGRVVAADRRRPASPNRAGCARSRSVPRRSRAARSRITRSRACSRPRTSRSELFTNDPERRRRRPVHGMGRRQERRRDASRTPAA